jgi:hypothetical protein
LEDVLRSHNYTYIMRLSSWGDTLWLHSNYRHEMDEEYLASLIAVPITTTSSDWYCCHLS